MSSNTQPSFSIRSNNTNVNYMQRRNSKRKFTNANTDSFSQNLEFSTPRKEKNVPEGSRISQNSSSPAFEDCM